MKWNDDMVKRIPQALMRTTVETEEIEIKDTGTGGQGPGGGPGGPGPGGGGSGRAMPAVPQRLYLTGMVMALAAILMFFMALTSAYIVRKVMSDWRSVTPPKVLWVNTLVLLASSATIQKARRQLTRLDFSGFRYWWSLTTALGVLFLAGQILAWRQLVNAGIYLASNPSSSFFYVLTAAHGLHLLGGILAFFVIGYGKWQGGRMTRATATEITAIYWHFLDGLWIFLFLLLNLGR